MIVVADIGILMPNRLQARYGKEDRVRPIEKGDHRVNSRALGYVNPHISLPSPLRTKHEELGAPAVERPAREAVRPGAFGSVSLRAKPKVDSASVHEGYAHIGPLQRSLKPCKGCGVEPG